MGGTAGSLPIAGATAANQDLKQGLVLYYDFDETSGNSAHDRLASANNGVVHGAALWTADGKVNGALKLAGGPNTTADPQYVEGPPGILRSLQQTTIAAWVRWGGGNLPWQRVFDFGTDVDHYFAFTPDFSDVGLTMLRTTEPVARTLYVPATPPVPVAQWAHVAVTWSASAISTYVNGELAGVSDSATPPGLAPSSLGITARCFLGRSQSADDPFFTGTIDEFRVYDRALSKADIVALRDYRP
jgi:hypothetical protein